MSRHWKIIGKHKDKWSRYTNTLKLTLLSHISAIYRNRFSDWREGSGNGQGPSLWKHNFYHKSKHFSFISVIRVSEFNPAYKPYVLFPQFTHLIKHCSFSVVPEQSLTCGSGEVIKSEVGKVFCFPFELRLAQLYTLCLGPETFPFSSQHGGSFQSMGTSVESHLIPYPQ